MFLDVTTIDASIAAGDFVAVQQHIEGFNLLDIADEPIVLAFYVKAIKTGTYCVSFRNDADDRSFVEEYTVDVTDTWELKTITLTHDSTGVWDFTNGTGMKVTWTIAAGTTFQTTAGTWQAGNFLATSNQVNGVDNVANDFRLSQIMLVRGSTAPTEFILAGKNIEGEVALCQRYYEKTYTLDIAPGTATSAGQIEWLSPDTLSSANLGYTQSFLVSKRTSSYSANTFNPSTGTIDQGRNATTGNNINIVVSTGAVNNMHSISFRKSSGGSALNDQNRIL